MIEYPKALYKGDVVNDVSDVVIVEDAASEAAQRKNGYAMHAEIIEGEKPDDRASLAKQAESLGIDVDARWGVRRLLSEIAAKGK